MKTKTSIALFALTVGLAGSLSATTVLQWGFDSTSGPVAAPINDDSGAGHHGTHQLFGTASYSADIPGASVTQYVTGIGSIDFTGNHASLSTAASSGVGSGQGMVTAAEIVAAGGLTLEIWIKNPAAGTVGQPGAAFNMAGMYDLGINKGNIGFLHGDNTNDLSWTTSQYTADAWNHLAVVLSGPNATSMSYTNVSSYLNGELIHSAALTLPFFLSRATSVGNHQYADWTPFEGLVYEPRVSLGALTPSQFTVVPEPAGMTMLALGGMALMARRRRNA